MKSNKRYFFHDEDSLITFCQCKPIFLKKIYAIVWEQRKLGEWGTFYYGHSCPKWSVTADATTPCIRYGELYTKFGTKIDRVFSYTNMPTNKLRFTVKQNLPGDPKSADYPYQALKGSF